MKTCGKCKISKELTEFSKDNSKSSGLSSRCKTCEHGKNAEWYWRNVEETKKRAAAWRKNNPKKVAISKRKNYLKRTYGLIGGDFDALVVAHNGKCAICHNPFSSSRDRHIDHCHVTGKVRGLLCSACNTILGMSKDSPKTLISAARYLKMARYLK